MTDPPDRAQPALQTGRVHQRPGEQDEQQHGQGDPQEQQEPLLDLDPAPVALNRELQISCIGAHSTRRNLRRFSR